MLYEVVFGISRRKEIKKPQMSGQVTATSHAEQEMVNSLKKWQDEPGIKRRAASDTYQLQTNPESQLLKANRSKMGPGA